MKILSRLKDIHFLKKQIKRLEMSLKSRDELIKRLEEENSSLNTRLTEMVLKYKDIDSRFAGINSRLYMLNRENQILKMNIIGARAQRDGMQRWIEKIKEQGYDSNK